MSENDRLHLVELKKKTDARVRRTRDALGDALVALMQEKPFETITVQDVLDRAHVGRSTFYSHYSDKDDLLMSDVDDFLRAGVDGLSATARRRNACFR
jgi:AcrR family transcriptional regulator